MCVSVFSPQGKFLRTQSCQGCQVDIGVVRQFRLEKNSRDGSVRLGKVFQNRLWIYHVIFSRLAHNSRSCSEYGLQLAWHLLFPSPWTWLRRSFHWHAAGYVPWLWTSKRITFHSFRQLSSLFSSSYRLQPPVYLCITWYEKCDLHPSCVLHPSAEI